MVGLWRVHSPGEAAVGAANSRPRRVILRVETARMPIRVRPFWLYLVLLTHTHCSVLLDTSPCRDDEECDGDTPAAVDSDARDDALGSEGVGNNTAQAMGSEGSDGAPDNGCPGGLVCSDGSCPRLRWDFESDDGLDGVRVEPSSLAPGLSIDRSGIAKEGDGALRIDVVLPAEDAEGQLHHIARLVFEVCPKDGTEEHTVRLGGNHERPRYAFFLEGDPLPSGAYANVTQIGYNTSRPLYGYDKTMLHFNNWYYADVWFFNIDYANTLGPEVASVATELSIPRDETWQGRVFIDGVIINHTGKAREGP